MGIQPRLTASHARLSEEYIATPLQSAHTIFASRVVYIIVFFLTRDQHSPQAIQFWIVFVISTWITISMIFCAYKGIKTHNSPCLCGKGYLDVYAAWCIVGAVMAAVMVVRNLWADTLIVTIFNLVFVVMYMLGGGSTRVLLELLLVEKKQEQEQDKEQTKLDEEKKKNENNNIPPALVDEIRVEGIEQQQDEEYKQEQKIEQGGGGGEGGGAASIVLHTINNNNNKPRAGGPRSRSRSRSSSEETAGQGGEGGQQGKGSFDSSASTMLQQYDAIV
jgi:hypothetical protein